MNRTDRRHPHPPSRARLLSFLADALTASRLLLAAFLAWLGASAGRAGLTVAVGLIMVGWTADTLDGHMAKWAGCEGQTLLGRHDVTVDMVFSTGGLAYFALAGFISTWLAVAYLAVAAGLLVLFPLRSMAIVIQAPAAVLPVAVGLGHEPALGLAVIAWALLLLLVDRRRFAWRLAHFWRGLADAFK